MDLFSALATVTTTSDESEELGEDTPLDAAEWEILATFITAKFIHSVDESHYYILWCDYSHFLYGVHRSKAITLPPEIEIGDELQKTIYGFQPESTIFAKVVSNPILRTGEQ